MQDNLTEQQEAEFMTLYGFIFSMSMCLEYIEAIQPILKAHNGRNALTKVLQAESVVSGVKGTIWHHFTKRMPPEQVTVFQMAIEQHSETVYKMFSLDPEKQRKVWELIEQLNNS